MISIVDNSRYSLYALNMQNAPPGSLFLYTADFILNLICPHFFEQSTPLKTILLLPGELVIVFCKVIHNDFGWVTVLTSSGQLGNVAYLNCKYFSVIE